MHDVLAGVLMNAHVSRARLGVLVTIVLIAALGVALSWSRIITMFQPRYGADFTEAGGLSPGDDVVVSGLVVGKVSSVDLVGQHVRVMFEISNGGVRLGSDTHASIESETLLGKMGLVLQPAGPGTMAHGTEIPIDRTTAPYNVTEALSDLTGDTSALHVNEVARAMRAISGTLTSAAPNIGPALNGVLRLSTAIDARNVQLTRLLKHSADVSGVLESHDAQIQTLLTDGTALLNELNQRSDAITELLANGTTLSQQLSGLVADNSKQIGPAFDQLNAALHLLQVNKVNINKALDEAAPLVRELGGIVSSFPGLDVYVPNLVPTSLVPGLAGLLTRGKQ
jgi:phospholipid/cholesterol/gamma-HCH transport system substrate-binding protein